MRKLVKQSKTHKALLQRDEGYRRYIDIGIDGESSFGMKYSRIKEICDDPIYQRIEKDDIDERQRKLKRGEFTEEMKRLLDNKPGKRGQTSLGTLDQFYTMPEVAEQCWGHLCKHVEIRPDDQFIEPAAGDGSFFKLMPRDRRIGLDKFPRCEGVQCMDFLKYEYVSNGKRVITLTNPPFGKNSSMAVRFFNHCAKFAEVIAFIVPKTFNKVSLQNKLDLYFHLKTTVALNDESFLFDGQPYKVPCCFQIWVKKTTPRERITVDLKNDLFTFVKKDECPDLAVRRVGGTVGKCTADIEPCKYHSYHFLKIHRGKSVEEIMKYINKLWSEKKFLRVASQSSGVRSMSRGEFITVLNHNPF